MGNFARNRKAAAAAAQAAEEQSSPPPPVSPVRGRPMIRSTVCILLLVVFVLFVSAAVFLRRSSSSLAPPPPPHRFSATHVPLSFNRSEDLGTVLKKLRRRKGYHLFSRALDSVVPSLAADIQAVTIFAPIRYRQASTLEDSVSTHIVYDRFNFKELEDIVLTSHQGLLTSLAAGRLIRLSLDYNLAVYGICVEGVEVMEPDLIVTPNVVVHGNFPSTSFCPGTWISAADGPPEIIFHLRPVFRDHQLEVLLGPI